MSEPDIHPAPIAAPIPALTAEAPGRQFLFYGDSCSGVAGALHARNLARVNAVIQRLTPPPDFLAFAGDEVIGLTPDPAALRAQWQHFHQVEMGWAQRAGLPCHHITGNHTVYDGMSAAIFAEVTGQGDPRQLSYAVRHGDVLLVCLDTLCRDLGGEGHVNLDWLRATLAAHRDARFKLVMGHHPAYAVNGFHGPYQRTIGAEYVPAFWSILAEHGVLAYLCSHILAFDVQCHGGILQITSGGAGTAHRMPEGVEYLHCVQMAVDAAGLRYQVLDDTGARREGLTWPPAPPARQIPLPVGPTPCALAGQSAGGWISQITLRGSVTAGGAQQTLLAAQAPDGTCPLWIGLLGRHKQLTVLLQPQPGRSPHRWLGPCLEEGTDLAIDLALHGGMGPGGLLWRRAGDPHWSSLRGTSAWGLERLTWPETLWMGKMAGPGGDTGYPGHLEVTFGSVPI